MKGQHTQGYWYTTSKADDLQGLICSEITGANVAVSYDPKDADIIAAAPDMLEALEMIDKRWTENCDPYGPDSHDIAPGVAEMWRVARAAIAKAKGH